MQVSVRLFAILRDRVGADRVDVDLPEPVTVAEALEILDRLPGLDGVARGGARLAVNREYVPAAATLAPGDELALIPPVSGGAPQAPAAGESPLRLLHVGPEPLSLDRLAGAVADPRAGGLVTFQGLPRDIPVLEYEAYADMALERMRAILSEAIDHHGLCAAAVAHRTGPVPAGEASIIVAASAPHRGEAFTGAREILDRIKAEAPIWKVEVDPDGRRHRPDGVLPR